METKRGSVQKDRKTITYNIYSKELSGNGSLVGQ